MSMDIKPFKLIEQWDTNNTDTWKYMAKWGIYGMKQSANKFRDVQLVIKDQNANVFKMRKLNGKFVKWD